MATNDAWLGKTVEPAMEPELPICDAHHHLWDFRADSVDPRYTLDEIRQDIDSGHRIVSTVFIECGTMYREGRDPAWRVLGETEFALGQAAMSASGRYGPTRVAAGIIGTALLHDDSAAAVLDRHQEIAGDRFKGIRQAAACDPSDAVPDHRTQPPEGLFRDSAFRRGFAELAPRQLVFEGLCYHPQMDDLVDLARAFSETTIVLNHYGIPLGIGPYRREDVFEPWRSSLRRIAECSNVVCKVGGLTMDLNGFGWHLRDAPPGSEELAAAMRPYFEHALECFGPGRCVFESNFPVDKVSAGYGVLWNALKRLASGCSDDEKAQLFHDNAARIYRLEE